ncbi:MAG: hypothetical protein KAI24_07465, partial [Planctomycetes bacterium]|nr:hypothetical protein [Planctomycetota bacterium]
IDGGAGPRSLGFGGPIALHPDGRRWLRAIGDRIELRAFAGDAAPRTFRNRHSRQSKAAVLTGDGRFAALAPSFQRGDLELFEVRTGRRLEVGGLPDDVTLLANHAGIELATMRALGRDGGVERRELQLWKVSGGERPRVDLVRTVPFAIEARGSRSLRDWPVLSRDLRYLSWGDQLVDLVDPARSTSLDDRWVIAIAPLRDELEGTRVVLSGRRLALASEVAVDAGGEQVAKLDLARPGDGMAVAPGGKRLALALADAVEVRSLPGLELLRRLPGQARIPAWVDDRHLLAVDGEHRLVLFAVRDERLLAALPLGSHVRQLDVRPALGVALVTLVDRSVLVRVRPR